MAFEAADELNPTFWRTCRVVANRNRLHLLREVIANDGLAVSGAAAVVGISVSHASQALRLLNSRGLLKVRRTGPAVIYRFAPDETIPGAALLSEWLKDSLGQRADRTEAVFRIMTAFTHPRRIKLLKELAASGETESLERLQMKTRISRSALIRHLKKLESRKLVSEIGGGWSLEKDDESGSAVGRLLALALRSEP